MSTQQRLAASLARTDLNRTQRDAIYRALRPTAGVNVYLTGLRAAGIL